MQPIRLTTIRKQDDPRIARIIRQTLTEFGIAGPGTVFNDEAIDHLSRSFSEPRSRYFVARRKNDILGGAGIHPLEGGDEETCELQKMYVVPEARGNGLGRMLMDECLAFAREAGFRTCYIETMPQLKSALKLYESTGFTYLKSPMGKTGHFACGLWMSITL
ncbi:MAG TPA: GNAT family N-acetyltransferase [Chitinophagaceae bacterium]|nr:GNAT family N-acetyltransferase [Chitinophagaceae bacterium]